MTPDIALTVPAGLIGKAGRRQSSVMAILLLSGMFGVVGGSPSRRPWLR